MVRNQDLRKQIRSAAYTTYSFQHTLVKSNRNKQKTEIQCNQERLQTDLSVDGQSVRAEDKGDIDNTKINYAYASTVCDEGGLRSDSRVVPNTRQWYLIHRFLLDFCNIKKVPQYFWRYIIIKFLITATKCNTIISTDNTKSMVISEDPIRCKL